jgi:hypothetical protein
MFKRSVILLSFLAYSLTLVHSIVPHHHHDKQVSDHHHHENSSDHHHHDDHEEKSVSQSFADATHFPGSEIVLHPQQSETIQKFTVIIALRVDNQKFLLSPQLKPPDLNVDHRPAFYSSTQHSLFLLRAPPVA